MNIVYLCHSYPPNDSGVGAFVQVVAKGLVEKGHKVFVIEPYFFFNKKLPSHRVEEGVEIIQYGTDFWLYKLHASQKLSARILTLLLNKTKLSFFIWLWKTYQCSKYVAEFVRQNNIDIVEVSDGNEGGLLVATPFDAECVVRIHGSTTLQEAKGLKPHGRFAGYFYKKIERKLISRANSLVAVSAFSGNFTKEIFGLKQDIPVIYNVVDIPECVRSESIVNYTLFVGRLTESKGVDTLAKAWNVVMEECPGQKLILMGNGDESLVWNNVKQEYHHSIILEGHQPRYDVLRHMANAQCFVLPSRYESFGIATVEALALGCACVYTERCAGPEIIDQNVNGILINPDDENELAQAIIKIIKDKEFAAKLRRNAKENSKRFTNVAALINENENFYSLVINKTAYA